MAAERLSGLDTAFLCLDREVTPMQLGALALFRPARPVRPEQMASLLATRARRIPRLHRRVQSTWFRPGAAQWAEVPGFRAEEHIHRHRLDGPGGRHLEDLVSELMAQPLRRGRPLWEFHVISGLDQDRFAVLIKLHHALGDGLAAQEIGIGLLDQPGPRRVLAGDATANGGHGSAPARVARPGPARTVSGRALSVVRLMVCGPWRAANRVRGAAVGAVGGAVDAVGEATDMLGMAASVLRSVRLPAPGSPLVVSSSGRRGLGLARLDLQQVNRIRTHFGGTVNDVLLAVVTGALREWLGAHGHPVDGMNLRALIPVSKRARSGRSGGNQLSGYLCELPIGEPDAGRRLRTIRQAMERSKAAGTTRGVGAIPLLAERLPAAVHRVAAPTAGQVAALLFDILVTSVPVPGIPLRLDGAELEEIFPVAPLAPGHALGVALSCYRGMAYIGLHADREALPDIQGLAEAITASAAILDRVNA